VTYKLLDSRLLRQRLETFLNCPRGGLEVIALDGPLRPRKWPALTTSSRFPSA